MKLKEYNVFGDDNEYCDITFIDESENKVVIAIKKDGNHTVECDGVTVKDLREILEMVASGKLEIEL